WSKPVHQLVAEYVSEERIKRERRLLCRIEYHLRDWDQRLIKLRVLHVLQHDALRAFFFNYALVVWKIESSRLHAAVAFARSEHFVHDANRRRRAEFRIAITRIDRQIIFQFLQMTAELRELCRLRIVPKGYVSLERSFVTKQLVLVRFVWSNRQVDRRVEVHPGDVAFIVIVGSERVGALVEKILQRCAGRE